MWLWGNVGEWGELRLWNVLWSKVIVCGGVRVGCADCQPFSQLLLQDPACPAIS